MNERGRVRRGGLCLFFGEHADIRRGSFQPAELTLILTFGIRA